MHATATSPHPRSPHSRGPHYLPTLDGWRTLAILSVMLCHDSIHHLGPLSTAWLNEHGNLGVDIFFSISGLLICSRLLTEEDARGCISLRGFYLRRAFRILPAAAVFLAALLLLRATVHLPVQLPEVLASLFFVRNYTSSFGHFQTIYPFYTSHFWSLAIEEHFYLLLPTLLVFTPILFSGSIFARSLFSRRVLSPGVQGISPTTPVPSAAVPSAAVPSAPVPSGAVTSAVVLSAVIPSTLRPSELVPSGAVPSAGVPSTPVPTVPVPSTLTKPRAATLIALATAIALHRIVPNSWLSFHTDLRLDALLIPAALAVLLRPAVLLSPAAPLHPAAQPSPSAPLIPTAQPSPAAPLIPATKNSGIRTHWRRNFAALLRPAVLAHPNRLPPVHPKPGASEVSPTPTTPTHSTTLPRLQQALRLWPLLALLLLAAITSNRLPRTTGLLIAWLTPLLILATMLRPQSWFSRLLESAPLRYLGRLSYSLYLWQQLFLIAHFGAGTARLGPLQAWPLNWFMTFACALVSFYLVEQPLIRLGHRIAPNIQTNRVDLRVIT